jgi:hypothetical protein
MTIVLIVLNLILNSVQTVTVTENQRTEIINSNNFIIIDDDVIG